MSTHVFTYVHVLGAIEAIALLYIIREKRSFFTRHHELLFAATGAVLLVGIEVGIGYVRPAIVHVVHAVAAGVIGFGLGELLVDDTTEDWLPDLFRREGEYPDWMTTMDEDIVAYLDASNSVLSPGIVAYNLEYSRESVNRHLRRLEDHGVVDRVDRGKYRLAERRRILGALDFSWPTSLPFLRLWSTILELLARLEELFLRVDRRGGQ